MYVGRRVERIVTFFAAAIATVAIYAVAPTAIHNRVAFGTFDTVGAPPRVDYCGRRYYPGNKTETLAQVKAFLAENGLYRLTRIDTAPSGEPIVTNVMPPELRAHYHTSVCAMELWVQTGPDAYVGYGLSGGP
jgi:hypothetical protein